MFELIFPTLKEIKLLLYGSHQNVKANYLIFIEQPRVFFSSKFHKVFQTQTKLYQPKKRKRNKNELGRRKMTGSVGGQVHKYNCKKNKINKK